VSYGLQQAAAAARCSTPLTSATTNHCLPLVSRGLHRRTAAFQNLGALLQTLLAAVL